MDPISQRRITTDYSHPPARATDTSRQENYLHANSRVYAQNARQRIRWATRNGTRATDIGRQETYQHANSRVHAQDTRQLIGWATKNGTSHSSRQGRQGCFNCGEFNHRQAQCRFDHKLLCESCNQYGHKQRLCKYYIQ
ncbi:hypothetical protein E2C01_077469 [Portunus trituberculatus]|uniref:CCHC-type domain-containing protein n=1 Tax=Portunus trituberculatus TaxID=210409 RepID=A0A5B7IM76_PORTR|nr:hypothetical protein [Portunus trituberculatus]